MTAETPELHIELRAPDGATWTSGESWASFKKRLEQLSSENTTIYSRLIHLEEQVDKLTRQERLMNALKILATETKPRTRGWVQNRVAKLSWGIFRFSLIREKSRRFFITKQDCTRRVKNEGDVRDKILHINHSFIH